MPNDGVFAHAPQRPILWDVRRDDDGSVTATLWFIQGRVRRWLTVPLETRASTHDEAWEDACRFIQQLSREQCAIYELAAAPVHS